MRALLRVVLLLACSMNLYVFTTDSPGDELFAVCASSEDAAIELVRNEIERQWRESKFTMRQAFADWQAGQYVMETFPLGAVFSSGEA